MIVAEMTDWTFLRGSKTYIHDGSELTSSCTRAPDIPWLLYKNVLLSVVNGRPDCFRWFVTRRSGEDVRGEEEEVPQGEVPAWLRSTGASGEGADVGLQETVCLHRPRRSPRGAAWTRADGGGEGRWVKVMLLGNFLPEQYENVITDSREPSAFWVCCLLKKKQQKNMIDSYHCILESRTAMRSKNSKKRS